MKKRNILIIITRILATLATAGMAFNAYRGFYNGVAIVGVSFVIIAIITLVIAIKPKIIIN